MEQPLHCGPGKEQPAREASIGIYESGLASIKSRLEPSGNRIEITMEMLRHKSKKRGSAALLG